MKYLAACAIVRDEAPYIEEWLKYHRGVGVEHFYIYLNECVDSTENLVKAQKDTSVFTFNGVRQQIPAYNHLLSGIKGVCEWVAFIDVDEFLVPKQHNNVPDVLNAYNAVDVAALCPHWVLFGSNGHEKYEDKPVIERFTRRQKDVNPHIKSIVKPHKTIQARTPHKFIHTKMHLAVDEGWRTIGETDSMPPNGTDKIIQINHYSTKSREECLKRRSRIRVDTGGHYPVDFFEAHDRNEVEDLRALELWKSLK